MFFYYYVILEICVRSALSSGYSVAAAKTKIRSENPYICRQHIYLNGSRVWGRLRRNVDEWTDPEGASEEQGTKVIAARTDRVARQGRTMGGDGKLQRAKAASFRQATDPGNPWALPAAKVGSGPGRPWVFKAQIEGGVFKINTAGSARGQVSWRQNRGT